jgi:hypothetical protein
MRKTVFREESGFCFIYNENKKQTDFRPENLKRLIIGLE